MSRNYYNVHTHIFNIQALPTNILGKQYGWVLFIAKKLRNSFFAKPVLWFITTVAKLIWKQAPPKMERIRSLLFAVIKKDQDEIYKNLKDTYHNNGYANFRFVILCQDMDHTCDVRPEVNIETQMRQVAEIRRQYADLLLPFVGVDPRHGTAAEIMRMVKRFTEPSDLKKRFVGIKLYPSSGFYGNETNLLPVFDYCVANDLPVMIHYNVGVVYFNADLKWFKTDPRVRFDTDEHKLFQMNFMNPVWFEELFTDQKYGGKYNKLKLCFAHFCGDFDQKTYDRITGDLPEVIRFVNQPLYTGKEIDKGVVLAYWHVYIREVLLKYENVYTDISFQLTSKDFNKLTAVYLKRNDLKNKILFGTDFYVNLKHGKEDNKLVDSLLEEITWEEFEQIASVNVERYLKSNFFTP